MYIGSTGERGLHHLVWEVVDNSVDEAMAGLLRPDRRDDPGATAVSRSSTTAAASRSTSHPARSIPAVTIVLTVLHAGGKFGGGGYKVSGGLHGVGISVVNALSRKVEVEIRRDGYRWTQSFSLGVPDGPLERHEATDETGTTTRFWPSEDIFETTDYNFETITTRFREMAFLNKGLEICVRDQRSHAEEIIEAVEDPTVDNASTRPTPPTCTAPTTAAWSAPSSTNAAWSTTSSTSTSAATRPTRASSASRRRPRPTTAAR